MKSALLFCSTLLQWKLKHILNNLYIFSCHLVKLDIEALACAVYAYIYIYIRIHTRAHT
jgi:hypothetical protein